MQYFDTPDFHLRWLDVCMELACALGALPHEVAGWPWRRVQRCWIFLRRKQRRDERQRIFLAHQSGMGAFGSALGWGGAGGATHDQDVERVRKAQSMGIPVTIISAEG
jgi:hypothetical protein